MNLYHFNPNDYGNEYFVMAENKIKALEYLLKNFEKLILNEKFYPETYKKYLETWSKINPLDEKTFPDKYTLNEHEIGSVIESEIS